jgi:hypothetical protein
MNPLEEAKQSLTTKGWRKDGQEGPNGERCLIFHLPIKDGVWEAVHDVLLEQYPDRTHYSEVVGFGIVQFNDHPDTTREDVDLVLEKAAALYEERLV